MSLLLLMYQSLICQLSDMMPVWGDTMMTSSNGNIFRVTGPVCGEFTGPGEFTTQRPVTRSFDVFFDLRLNKRLSKQPWGWWFETPSWSLWRQCNANRACHPGGLTETNIMMPFLLVKSPQPIWGMGTYRWRNCASEICVIIWNDGLSPVHCWTITLPN